MGRIIIAFTCVLLLVTGTAIAGVLPGHEPDATVSRTSVPDVYKWDITVLFADDGAWEAERESLAGEMEALSGFKGKLVSPKELERCLSLYFDLHNRTNHVTMYAALKLITAQSDSKALAMQQAGLSLMDALMSRSSFIRAELLAIPAGFRDRMYEVQPGLAIHRAYIDNILRRADRVLDTEAERVLSLAGDNLWAEIDLNEIPSPLEETFRSLMSNIPWPTVHDEAGNEIQMTLANYGRFRESPDRKVRQEAVTTFMATLRQYQDALTATFAGQFKLDVFYARSRHYDTALEAYLDKDGLSTDVFHNLIATVNANLEPLHHYVEVRKKALGYEDLHLYDLYVPMVKGVAVDVPFTEACKTLMASLEPLGEEYLAVVEKGLDPANGSIDLYPNLDKESGASSSSVYGRHPFIKMNYQNSLDDVSTLAHEFGHLVHSDLAMKNQPYSSFRYVPFLAEIASTINEKFLSDYMVRHARTREEKAYILTALAENIRTTIYRQTLFSEFELQVHGFIEQGRPVTADLLDRTYAELIRRYYGQGYTVDSDDGMEWAYIPHFYYKFYMFSYATGLSSGIALADRIENGGEEAVQAFLGMLAGGSSRPPLDLLRSAGVDLSRPEAIEAALKLFEETVTELEKLL